MLLVKKVLRKQHFFIMASILLSAMAQLSMKAGMVLLAMNSQQNGFDIGPALTWTLAGLGCYAVSLLFWMSAIARLELSFAYPLLSLSYVLVYIAAARWPLLNESVSPERSIGIAVVILGVILVSQSRAPEPELILNEAVNNDPSDNA